MCVYIESLHPVNTLLDICMTMKETDVHVTQCVYYTAIYSVCRGLWGISKH